MATELVRPLVAIFLGVGRGGGEFDRFRPSFYRVSHFYLLLYGTNVLVDI